MDFAISFKSISSATSTLVFPKAISIFSNFYVRNVSTIERKREYLEVNSGNVLEYI